MPQLVAEWAPGFSQRLPRQVALDGIQRFWLLTVFYLLDSAVPQRVAQAEDGCPLFSVNDIAGAIGMNGDVLAGLAINWSLTFDQRKYLQYIRDESGRMQSWIRLGGLLPTLASIQLHQVPTWECEQCLARIQVLIKTLLADLGLQLDDFDQLNALFSSATSEEVS